VTAGIEGTLHADIVEVVTTGTRRSNVLLAQGWRLLYISHETRAEKVEGMQPFVKRFVVFVLGRTNEVPTEDEIADITEAKADDAAMSAKMDAAEAVQS